MSGQTPAPEANQNKTSQERPPSIGAVINNSDDAIVGATLSGVITSWNDAALKIYGFSEEGIAGKSISILLPEEQREDLPNFLGTIEEGSFPFRFETQRQKKDGRSIDLSVIVSPVKNEDGVIVGISAIAHDVTELKKLERQLLNSQKMEAVGRLTGGIVHDFNNLLMAICGYSHLMLERLGPQDPLRADLEEIQKAGERAASLTYQLLAFSRHQPLQTKILDINTIVRDAGKLLLRLIGENIRLEAHLKSKGLVKVDPGQLEQIIINLVANARDSMPQGGRITLETADAELGEEYAQTHTEVRPGPYVMLAISDSGSGMDPKILSHLFEPFFTTKEEGKGTGFGLSTVHSIVEQNGGSIFVYSEPNFGTAFKIYLPKTADSMEPREGETPAAKTRGGSETILLVEDEESVRKMVHRVLTHKGYKVLPAKTSYEALEICKWHCAPIPLMVSDVILPGMDGKQLAKAASVLHPEMKVVFMSGFTEDIAVYHGLLSAGIALMQKPLTPNAISQKVREVLDQPK